MEFHVHGSKSSDNSVSLVFLPFGGLTAAYTLLVGSSRHLITLPRAARPLREGFKASTPRTMAAILLRQENGRHLSNSKNIWAPAKSRRRVIPPVVIRLITQHTHTWSLHTFFTANANPALSDLGHLGATPCVAHTHFFFQFKLASHRHLRDTLWKPRLNLGRRSVCFINQIASPNGDYHTVTACSLTRAHTRHNYNGEMPHTNAHNLRF